MSGYLEHSERWRHHGQPREASHWAAGDKAVLHLGPVKGCEECREPEPVCECFVTPEETWLSAASCGYGSGYEPGSQMEWNPDCPAHRPPDPEPVDDAEEGE